MANSNLLKNACNTTTCSCSATTGTSNNNSTPYILDANGHIINARELKQWIIEQAYDLGFSACGVSNLDTHNQVDYLKSYIEKGYAANMQSMYEHVEKRDNPQLLVPFVKSIITVRMDVLTARPKHKYIPHQPDIGVIARYAQGRDYHKTVRLRLRDLGNRIAQKVPSVQFRPFVDSAPIFEKTFAENAGLGWKGKHTLLISRQAGSFFMLGELFVSIDLPIDQPVESYCGTCTACIDHCPTKAIVAPYEVDPRLCIAYLNIEYKGSIPIELRRAMGNRIFGCDDCQLICPWNKFVKPALVPDFNPRHGFDQLSLLNFWQWDEAAFLQKTEGSPLRRIGYICFMRNVAVALGNAPKSQVVIQALNSRLNDFNELVKEHIEWAIFEQSSK